ncbi:DUF1642 domain-containing protein [Streptococcus sp.]
MNKQELIKEFEEIGIYKLNIFGTEIKTIPTETAIELIKQLDEPETGHADEAPRYLKNVLARLRELPLHNREVWLKVIMSEFKQDFSHAKWREGYEQGKLEGMVERKKVKVKKFVADWYEEHKDEFEYNVWDWLSSKSELGKIDSKFAFWLNDVDNKPIQTLVNMHQFGYEVDEEKRYLVKIKASGQYIMKNPDENVIFFYSKRVYSKLTRKELEEAGYGWVFNCEGIEIEEVQE